MLYSSSITKILDMETLRNDRDSSLTPNMPQVVYGCGEHEGGEGRRDRNPWKTEKAGFRESFDKKWTRFE